MKLKKINIFDEIKTLVVFYTIFLVGIEFSWYIIDLFSIHFIYSFLVIGFIMEAISRLVQCLIYKRKISLDLNFFIWLSILGLLYSMAYTITNYHYFQSLFILIVVFIIWKIKIIDKLLNYLFPLRKYFVQEPHTGVVWQVTEKRYSRIKFFLLILGAIFLFLSRVMPLTAMSAAFFCISVSSILLFVLLHFFPEITKYEFSHIVD